MFARLREDIACILERDPAARSSWEALTCYPGLHALVFHRRAHWFWQKGFRWMGRFVSHIGRFFTDRMFGTPWRLVPLGANGQPAFAGYQGEATGGRFRLAGINVLAIRTGRIAWIASFLDPDVHRHFGLPSELRPDIPARSDEFRRGRVS